MAVPDVTEEGILKTSISWDDFESKLKTALGTEARLGPNKAVLDIGDGNGFASCCGLIICDWVGTAIDEKLPKAVVIKIPSILPLRRLNAVLPEGQKMFNFDEAGWAHMEGQLTEIHNNEVATYDFLEEFSGLIMPRKIYGHPVVPEEKVSGQLCLEYMENTRTMNFHEVHSVDQVTQIARALGKIQACSLKKEHTDATLQKDLFKEIAQHWNLETFRGMFKGMAAVDSSEKTTALMEKVDALVPAVHASFLDSAFHTKMGYRGVIVNGDLHTGNVLINKDSEDLAALIDWQCTHFGVGVEDLHRISMSALLTKDRRTAFPKLVEEMYNSMVANLDGVDVPYSLEQLFVLSDLLFPLCALFLTSNLITFITKMDKDPKLTEEEKSARREVMLDKVIGVLEDVLELDEKNNNIKK